MWKYNQTEIQHHGVPGMRWGRQEKVSASISKFKESAKAHEAKTAARDNDRQEKVKNVINKIKNSAAMKKTIKRSVQRVW